MLVTLLCSVFMRSLSLPSGYRRQDSNNKAKAIGYVRQKDIDEARYPEMIINMVKKSEFIARADVVNLLHVNEDKAYHLLKSLAKQGALTMVNKGRYAKYKLNTK